MPKQVLPVATRLPRDVEVFCRENELRSALTDFIRLVGESLPVVGRPRVRIQQDQESEACWIVVDATVKGPASKALAAYRALVTRTVLSIPEAARSRIRLSVEVD